MQDTNCCTTPQGESQVVSKERVAAHGEVFTAPREVNAMLDLVKGETERIESRFLEPACGTGNFMIEILRRKLRVVGERYGRSQKEYELYAACALSSIYGVDILEDNVEKARKRLLEAFTEHYARRFKQTEPRMLRSAEFLLRKNIIWGDALSMMTVSEPPQPITFSEWAFLPGGQVKRRDYTLSRLLDWVPSKEPDLFSDLGERAAIPDPVKEFPLTHFLKLSDNEESSR